MVSNVQILRRQFKLNLLKTKANVKVVAIVHTQFTETNASKILHRSLTAYLVLVLVLVYAYSISGVGHLTYNCYVARTLGY